LDEYLERLGLSSAFDAVVRTHGSGLASKPAPDVFLSLAEQLSVLPEHCVVVEDSVPGCQAAIAAGMTVLVCPTIATAGCRFPDDAVDVASLADIRIEELETMLDRAGRSSAAGRDMR
jgi:beta-phosphoglucomutase-like phosphatase (HAD superfamily)